MDVIPSFGILVTGNDGRLLGAPSVMAIGSGDTPAKAENATTNNNNNKKQHAKSVGLKVWACMYILMLWELGEDPLDINYYLLGR